MNHIQEGQRVPEVRLRVRESGRWSELSTAELFAGRRVVVFGLPGAFTPTCSTSHVPRYEELAPELARHGIDEVICVSVNDAFVMEAWGRDQGALRVRLLPDGNGALTDALGFLVGKEELGFGKRSWRYSMVVRDGVVEKLFVEREVPGDPYDVSDADTMLRYVSHDAPRVAPLDVVLVTKPGCSHCTRARAMLTEAGIAWEEVRSTPRILRALSGLGTTPQVFVDGAHVGGADELGAWLASRVTR